MIIKCMLFCIVFVWGPLLYGWGQPIEVQLLIAAADLAALVVTVCVICYRIFRESNILDHEEEKGITGRLDA